MLMKMGMINSMQFYKVNVKSLVWYSPDNFEDNGYEVPTTMEDLIALTEQMANDGNTPWCIDWVLVTLLVGLLQTGWKILC